MAAAPVPETRYVERPDGVSIAYQVVGEGPRDLLYVPGFISHLDLAWTEPRFASFIRRLAGFARVIMFDKPGTGLSDPITHIPTVEERAEDIGTVLDAAGSSRAVLMGFSEGVSSCVVYAATTPERVESLVLFGGIFVGLPGSELLTLAGITEDVVRDRWGRMDAAVANWGSGDTIELLCPSATSPAERRFWGLFERAAASPRMARGLNRAAQGIDVSEITKSVRTPTLLIHNVDDFVPVAQSRAAAAQIPDARLVELPGIDHAFWMGGNTEPALGEIEEFVSGSRHAPEPDRVLATVLFADIVGSTRTAAELGDARWREMLERHEAAVRRLVETWRGRVVKTMGDGHLCVFDGPARAIRCGLAIRDGAEAPVRVGVHTGECEVMGEDLGGITVHIGARVGALARPGEVLVSSTVKDLVVGSPLAFADRGDHELKGVPGTWRLFATGPADAPPPVSAERELRPADRVALRLARRAPGTMGRAAALTRRLGRSS